jgi:molybdopterin-guanine dinucleotide biosynthesis protein A
MNVLGVILCGGQSSRMGTDKGLLPYADGSNWAQHQYELLQSLCPEVVVSVNPVQKNNYRAYFSEEHLVSDHVALQIKGPLLGLISVHLAHPSKDIFLLACDMINMKEQVLQALLQRYLQYRNKEAWAFTNEEGFEPLCAIYTAAALTGILQQYNAGQINRFSMKSVLEKIQTESIPVEPVWKTCFANFNDREELDRF